VTETETKWAERVRQWRASGKACKEFAAGQDFKPSTLRYWASELNRRSPKEAKVSTSATRVRLVRVQPVARRPSDEPIVVTIGGARVEVRAGFDRALLREVLEALGGRP
jgi:hypothetical protein